MYDQRAFVDHANAHVKNINVHVCFRKHSIGDMENTGDSKTHGNGIEKVI